jgi:gliding motility-associated-like protein
MKDDADTKFGYMEKILQLKNWGACMILLLLFSAQQVKASHSMGADLTYTCLGGNTYQITLTFYRDCIGIAAPTNPFVTINSSSCGQSLGVTCYPRPGTGQEVTPACSSSVTTCNGGSFTGIQEWIYDGIITLPQQCSDWVFGYALCCRNAAITNIVTPGSSTFYIYATLDNLAVQCNNSPTFSNKPVPFVCNGQQYCFNHGAYDLDGDSLGYQLITPYQTATTNIVYNAPYTATQPLNSVPAVTFNPQTGDICMTPQSIEVTVMAVLVSEYRNGVLIGTVERDMQITVMNCNNNLPSLTGINGTNNFSITVCANEQTCFDIFSIDPDAGQNLSVTWDSGIPAGTFTSTSAQHPVSTFCWTPTSAEIGGTFSFTVRVADDACPYIGSQIYSYSITVIGISVDAGPDVGVACSDVATLTANASGGGPYTYSWSNGSTAQAITVGAGTYVVTASNGLCTATDTVIVTEPYIPTAAFTADVPPCANSIVSFYDASSTPSGNVTGWNWDFGDGSTSTLANPVHLYGADGTYNVTLIIETSLGCFDTLTLPITLAPPPVADFYAADGCAGSTTCFNNTTTSAGTITVWNWNFGDGTNGSSQSPCHTYATAGMYTVTLIAGDSLACTDTVTHTITIYDLPTVSITGGNACLGSSISFTATGGLAAYSWNYGDGATGTGQNPTYSYYNDGTFTVTLTTTDTNGCTVNATTTVTVFPPVIINAGADAQLCMGDTVTLTATGGGTYAWSNGATTASINVFPSTYTTYSVTVTDANGCTGTDDVAVTVNPNPVPAVSPDQNICQGSSATLTASGGTSYSWFPGGFSSSSISVTPATDATYVVQVSNGLCFSYDTVQVFVHQAPVVNLAPVFICNGGTATLDAGIAGLNYLWSTGATTQTINISVGGTYSVTVSDPFGCSTVASTNATLGGSLNVTLPTASFCQGDSIVIDPGYTGYQYAWSTGATTQSITVYNAGTYTLNVTDTATGCSGTITATALVNPLPSANFTATNVCIGSSTLFTDISNISTGVITSWSWNFGDGSVSGAQNPSHTYASAGTYTVSLAITSSTGCNATYTGSVSVNPLPVANFTALNSCQNASSFFTDLSSVSSGNITAYAWSFGDGGTSTQQNPSHSYAASGNFNVTLQVTTAGGCTHSITQPLSVYPLPVASFTGTTVCIGAATNFTNTSTISAGGITSASWNFGDLSTSTTSNPSHAYATSGTFNVTLIVTSSNGCTDTVTQPVTVNALPVASAGADQHICYGGSATLSASGGTTYAWSPGNGTTATITVNPSANITYTVTVTNANGCVANDAATIYVHALPTVNAGVNQNICNGSPASLTASSSGSVTYLWNPGALATQTIAVNPSTSTNYIVTATDAYGCIARDTVLVTVNPIPAINAGPDQTICEGSTISLTASGAPNLTWYPGNISGATMLVTPNANATYFVVGVSSAGCQSSDTVNVVVNPIPVVAIPPTFVCPGTSTVLDAGNAGSAYSWSTGETTQTITVSDSGSYSVIVTTPNGCSTLGNTQVTIGGAVTGNPTILSLCTGQSGTLSAGNAGSTYLWSNGATTQSISVNTAGSYSVAVTDANGCSATFINTVSVNPIPVPAFSAPPVCFGTATVFTSQSTISSGSITGYSWGFGNGYSSSAVSPSYTYAYTGSYGVTLSVTSNAGCSAYVTQYVTVYQNPNAAFTSTPVCLNSPINYTDQSTPGSGAITGWQWNFGDGTTSGAQAAAHNFTSAGTYTTSLVVTSSYGCVDTVQHQVVVNGLPVAAFTAANVCDESAVTVNNTSTSNYGTIASYQWTMGDGNTFSAQNPSHTYADTGYYTIQLVVTSSLGCTDTITDPVVVYPMPAADFSTVAGCQNSTMPFTNLTSISSGSILSYSWNFGDGTATVQANPSHSYTSTNTFNVTLIATSNYNCRDTITYPLTVYPLPVASFTALDACQNSAVNFIDNSSISSGSIAQWSWNLGDGTSSTQDEPIHNYALSGTFNVLLNVTSDQGCISTYTQNVNIFPMPQVAFTANEPCYGSATQFYNQSSLSGGGSFTTAWDFGNGQSSTANNPNILFNSTGSHNVTLTVTSANGCVSTLVQPALVHAQPLALFGANDNCLGQITDFTDQSVASDGNIASWNWTFGDNSASNVSEPQHMYINTGQFSVALAITTTHGCTDQTTRGINIWEVPSPQIAANNACLNDTITMADISSLDSTLVLTYNWDMGDGTTSTQAAPDHHYPQYGTYDITVTVVNQHGCASTDLAHVTVYPLPNVQFTGDSVCLTTANTFLNTTSIPNGGISGYTWNFGDGGTATTAQTNHMYTNAGTYNVTLVAVSNHGCINTALRTVLVKPNPVALFTGGGNGCSDFVAQFTDHSTTYDGTITAWLWDFGDGDVSTNRNPQHTYTQAGSYPVTLTVVSTNGCQAILQQNGVVNAFPSPLADFEMDNTTPDNISPVIHYTNLSSGYNAYTWTFGDGSSTSSEVNPVHVYADTGSFVTQLVVVNSYGCRDTILRTIEIGPRSTLFAPNCFTPNGDGMNDLFFPKWTQMKEIYVVILDRWGLELTSWRGLYGSWDGNYQGKPVQDDVYIYKIHGIGNDNVYYEWVGHVSVVR